MAYQTTELISVIMPAYNAEAFIKEAIQSVMDQTYQHWELIVIDDGSMDSTAEIAKEFARNDSRIKHLHQLNGKQGKARNLGIQNSNGNYIAFLDADDKWTKDKLALQYKTITEKDDIDLVFSQGYRLDSEEISDFNVRIKDTWAVEQFPDFLQQNQIPILSVFAKKSPIINAGCFAEDPKIQNAEDYHLWLKMLVNGCRFTSIADRTFYYRLHMLQATYQDNNTTNPRFFTYINIYHYAKTPAQKKAVIDILKWFIFKKEFRPECIELFRFHFKQKGMNAIAFLLKQLGSKWNPLSQRVAFKLISVFG